MKKILFSIALIAVVGGTAVGATYAFFTSNQAVAGNTVSTGTLLFTGVIQDEGGTNTNFSKSGLAPGQSYTRCLWVKNDGTVPGRFKVYATAESGDTALGNLLTMSVRLNPDDGVCSDNTAPFSFGSVYGPSDFPIPTIQNEPVRGGFLAAATTPFKIGAAADAMAPNTAALYEVVITLDEDATQQSSSYTVDAALFGMQAEGSDDAGTW